MNEDEDEDEDEWSEGEWVKIHALSGFYYLSWCTSHKEGTHLQLTHGSRSQLKGTC